MNLSGLKDVREKLLGYRFDTVARLTGIDRDSLRRIEAGVEKPSFFEIEMLARVYGIDAERLLDDPIQLAPGDSIEVLTSLDEFKDIDDFTRARIVAAANAARDLVELHEMVHETELRTEFLKERPRLSLRLSGEPPHQQGAELARQLRKELKLGQKPIKSLRDLAAEVFPHLPVLYAELGSDGPAGLGFADPLRGPVIVLNTQGKNENPCVRRFSLAHELCHLLIDWNGREPLASISGYLNERALDRERRANAFAVRFLCPATVLRGLREPTGPDSRNKLAEYGLPYAAWRLYLRNERDAELPSNPPPAWRVLDSRWSTAEEPLGIKDFPLSEVPTERRTIIAELTARLYSSGEISRDEFAEKLGVTPNADVERVLDFFTFSRPETRYATSA